MGTPYNPKRDPDGLFRRARIEERQTVRQFLKSYVPPSERGGSGQVACSPRRKVRPADDFAWEDFLKSARQAVEENAPC